jgi:hypothetical protein
MNHNEHRDEGHVYHFLPEAGTASGGSTMWDLLWRHYSSRLFGTSACWLLWDVAFYGNKLFQSSFLLALIGEKNGDDDNDDEDITQMLLTMSAFATLNAVVSFCGYLVAAFLVDQPTIGRRKLQLWGLIVTGTLFIACGLLLDQLEASSSSSWLVMSLYLGTSFFGQVGPNATTFRIPAEIFPTEIRTVCHGIAVASGKLGALLAAVVFYFAQSDLHMFLLSGYACLVAGALTFWTIPESLGLPLHELDQKWNCVSQNKVYTGVANHAKYLSLYERNQFSVQAETQHGPVQHQQAYQ